MRKKQKKFSSIGDVLANVGGKGFREKLRQYELWDAWREIAGDAVADHSQPYEWRQQTLVVHVSNHSWIQELTFMKEDILSRIREKFPHIAIKTIRFEIGRITD